jgi:hypothetical protein
VCQKDALIIAATAVFCAFFFLEPLERNLSGAWNVALEMLVKVGWISG